jgi:hypothetical protein
MYPGYVVRIEEEGAVTVVAVVGCGGGTGRRRGCQRRATAKKCCRERMAGAIGDVARSVACINSSGTVEREEEVGADDGPEDSE